MSQAKSSHKPWANVSPLCRGGIHTLYGLWPGPLPRVIQRAAQLHQRAAALQSYLVCKTAPNLAADSAPALQSPHVTFPPKVPKSALMVVKIGVADCKKGFFCYLPLSCTVTLLDYPGFPSSLCLSYKPSPGLSPLPAWLPCCPPLLHCLACALGSGAAQVRW